MKIGIMTDSSVYLSKEEQARYQIKTLPITLIWNNKTYRDMVDIGFKEFYQRLKTEKSLPSTSQVTLAQVKEAVNQYVKENYTDVFLITLSSGITTFYNSILPYARQEKRLRLHLFDSKITCAGQGNMAILAARLAQAGASPETIMAKLTDLRATTGVRFMVDDLKHLVRTGRLSNASSFIGGILHMKPILTMDVQGAGQITAIAKERQEKRAFNHIKKDIAQATSNVTYPVLLSVIDANDAAIKQRWLKRLQIAFPHDRLYSGIIGPVIGVHTGPGTIAVVWQRDPNSYFNQDGSIK